MAGRVALVNGRFGMLWLRALQDFLAFSQKISHLKSADFNSFILIKWIQEYSKADYKTMKFDRVNQLEARIMNIGKSNNGLFKE